MYTEYTIKFVIAGLSLASPRVFALLSGAALALGAYRTLSRVRVKSLIRNIPGLKNESWFAGNFLEIYDVLNIRWHHETTRKYGGVFQINGMFGDEQLYITDPRAMHQVIVKGQAIFEEPRSLLVMNHVLFGDGLLATLGDYHKKQRKILNPVFSEKHIRGLLPIFWPITQKLCNILESKLSSEAPVQVINVYEWAGRTALEFIAQGGLGTSLDSMVDGETSEYTKLVKEMIPTVSRLHILMQLLPLGQPLFALLPASLRAFLLEYSPFSAVRQLNSITDCIENTSRDVLARKKAEVLAEIADAEGEKGRDILSVLLRAQSEAPDDERLPDAEVIGHITTLIFAAQDTTSSAITHTLHTLAQHPAAQARLRSEVRSAQRADDNGAEGGKTMWEYDTLVRLPYLDAVVRETLRLHDPVSWIWRIARKPTTLPLRRALMGTDGQPITAVPVAKNQGVVIGIAAANRDEAVWGADAWEWRPERWLGAETGLASTSGGTASDSSKTNNVEPVATPGNETQRKVLGEARYPGVYSGMMTFSGGGRSCIGFKFALLSLKLVLASLIDEFEFAVPDEEIVWNMNHIAAPTVKGRENEGAQMPLKVSLAA